MATKNYRYESLPDETKKSIQDIINQYVPSNLHDQVLKDIENSGAVQQGTFDAGKFNPTDRAMVNDKLSGLLAGNLSPKKNAIDQYLKNQLKAGGGDVANLTTAELNDRLSALQEQGKAGGNTLDQASVEREVQRLMGSFGLENPAMSGSFAMDHPDLVDYKGTIANPLKQAIVTKTMQLGRYPTADEIRQSFPQLSNLGEFKAPIDNFINDQGARDELSKFVSNQLSPVDTSVDTKAIQDILNARGKTASANADIAGFFGSAPGDLAKTRSTFYDSLRGQAKDYVSSTYAPAVKEQLAARGLEDSGQVSASITSKYGDLFAGITDEEVNQMMQDANFFGQQQYDKTFGDLVAAGQDVGGSIASAKNTLRSNQLQDFSKSQANIEGRFNLDLYRQQASDAMANYAKNVALNNRRNQDAATAGAYGEAGQAGAQIASTAVMASLL